MRDSVLKIKGLFGISDSVEIHFPKQGLIAIQGENGAGKSSILDSFSVAMFGEPTPARAVKNTDILSRSEQDGSVSLVFRWGEKTYRIDREFKRTKKDTVNHKAFLYRILPDGSEEGEATGPDAVSEEVARIISGGTVMKEGAELVRIVRSAWLSSVFLPQGEITRLLKMKPSERREIISALFGLEEGGVLKERSRELLSVADNEMKKLSADEKLVSETLSSHSVKSVGEAEENIKTLSSRAASIEKLRNEESARHALLVSLSEVVSNLKRNARALHDSENILHGLEHGYKLSEAKKEITRLRESGKSISRSLDGIKSMKLDIAKGEEVLASREKEVAELETERNEISALLEKVRAKADHAGAVKAIRELRTTLAGVNSAHAAGKKEHTSLMGKKSALLSVLAEKIVHEHEQKVAEGTLRYSAAAERAKTAGDSIKDRLVDWIVLLSGGTGSISVQDVKSMDAASFAESLASARFSELLSDMGKAKGNEETARTSLEELKNKLAEAMEEASAMMELLSKITEPAIPDASLSSMDSNSLRKILSDTDRSILSLEGKMEGLVKTMEDLKKRGMELKATLSGVDEDECLKAAEEKERFEAKIRSLSVSMERALSSKGSAQLSVETLRGKLNTSLSGLDGLREKMLSCSAAWRQAVSGWGVKDFRDMNSLSAPVEAVQVEKKRRECLSLAGIIRELEDKRQDIQSKHPHLSMEPEVVSEEVKKAASAVAELDSERISLATAIARAEKDLETYRSLTARLRRIREEMKSILPAYEKAKVVSKLLEGNSFGNFLQDRALSILLEYVNAGLQASGRYSGYSFSSSGGAISVTDHHGTRDAASLSGGEATMATLLLLRGMQSVSGIGGVMAIDEGFAQLDTKNLEDAIDVLASLSTDSLIIAITHDPDFAREFDVIWKVEKGGKITVQNGMRVSGKEKGIQEVAM